eukprot:TRINITY_DN11718_c0_g1_i3.p1 TRINITY_DN11718_c0_g1~~TRINITY_DN11718_c0_g1_i3.p1  ORF type:complete len:226 (-),score=42.03 TRINITY_DN11718_c0_g1_i3:119-796(-)
MACCFGALATTTEEEVSQDASASSARQREGPSAPCGPAWQEGFVRDMLMSSEATVSSLQGMSEILPAAAQALGTQDGADATGVAEFDLLHGQDDLLGGLSKSDSWTSMSALSEGGTDISDATTDCSAPGSMPAWLRERVVRQGDANPIMEFQREERVGQRALIVGRSLSGEVVAEFEEPESDDDLSERSDPAEFEIERTPSGLAMAQFLSENIRQRERPALHEQR